MMKTHQQAVFADASRMSAVKTESVHLVVTSPPYPMIAMWDEIFCRQARIRDALNAGEGALAFEYMHRQLDRVWSELWRVLMPGGIACINIGDATRTLQDEFALYPNHSRVLRTMLDLGFTNLPPILWRKPTNAPNKFMGSGMLPPGAYVTLEHEYILVLRKGGKRKFRTDADKIRRRQSAYFWEERNHWFSDVWIDVKGIRQTTADQTVRQRSGAYPFELAYRLIAMFSVLGDTVLDPFLGTGTTLCAAAASGRNGIGYEIDASFATAIGDHCRQSVLHGCQRIAERLNDHLQFIQERHQSGKPIKHRNRVYGFPVVTRQETGLTLPLPHTTEESETNRWTIRYDLPEPSGTDQPASIPDRQAGAKNGQLSLFK